MAAEASKRSSDQHASVPSHVPSAGPAQQPAAPRYADVAKNVFEKLPFRIGQRRQYAAPTAAASIVDHRHGSFASMQAGTPSASQSTCYDTGLKIRALDINRARTHVVLAGTKLLRTVRVDGTKCEEDFDIRQKTLDHLGGTSNGRAISRATQVQSARDVAATQRAFFDIEDVAWSNGRFDRIIATAASNGAIILYDLDRAEVEVQRLEKHDRQVHKVDFNPIEGKSLLSGSQDGTVILWDLRMGPAHRIDCARAGVYDSRSDGVRHVKWSPVDDCSFAFSTDNGFLHRWDIRQQRTPVWKVAAHEGTCTSMDWHPDGRHVVSAGKDKTVKVWAVSHEQRRRKSLYELRTPYEVQNVRWRPVCTVIGPDATPSYLSTQVATSYKKEPVLHVWDLRRPAIPFTEIHHSLNKGTTDMLWHSRDQLWSVGPNGRFMQSDVYHTPRVINRRPLQSLAASTAGETIFFLQKRPLLMNSPYLGIEGIKGSEKDDKPTASQIQATGFGRSFGDDSLDERFLSPPFIRRSSSQTKPSSWTARSLGSTPPSMEGGSIPVMHLDQAMKRVDRIKPVQIARVGVSPGYTHSVVFTYLAQRSKIKHLDRELSIGDLTSVEDVFVKIASHMQRVSRYRDGQTWKMLGRQLSIDLRRRSEVNRKLRLDSMPKLTSEASVTRSSLRQQLQGLTARMDYAGRSRKDLLQPSKPWVASNDTYSDAATPLARPTQRPDLETTHGDAALDNDPVQLPPSITDTSQLMTVTRGDTRQDEARSSLERTISHQNDRRAMVNDWKAQPKAPLNLEQPIQRSSNIAVPSRLNRRESSESFLMFSTSSGSHPKISAPDSLVSGESRSTDVGADPNWQLGGREPSSFHSTESNGTDSSGIPSAPRTFDIETSFGSSPRLGRKDAFANQHEAFYKASDSSGQVSLADESGSFTHCEDSSVADDVTGEIRDRSANYTRQSPRDMQVVTIQNGNADVSSKSPANIQIDGSEDVFSEQPLVLDFISGGKDAHDGLPFSAADMLVSSVKWYAAHADAQMASNLVVQSLPYLAPSISFGGVDYSSKHATSIAYAIRSLYGQLDQQDAMASKSSMMRALDCVGIDALWMENILQTYHEQLVESKLLIPAASLRKVAYPDFPAVYEQGLQDVQTGLLCLQCKSPINNVDNKFRCETCLSRQAECPICWSHYSPFGSTPLTKQTKKSSLLGINPPVQIDHTLQKLGTKLWSSCAICNHSAHAACAYTWFEDTEAQGACPIAGCLCDCTQGLYRDERLGHVEAAEIQTAARRGGIRRDDWSVLESRAVGRVRGALKEGRRRSSDQNWSGSENPRVEDERRVRIRTPGGMRSPND